MKSRFTLQPGHWYACHLVGDFFADSGIDQCSRSPIKVQAIHPEKTGSRRFSLSFYHANYPQGAQDKAYRLETLEQGQHFLLARAFEYDPIRLLYLHEIDAR